MWRPMLSCIRMFFSPPKLRSGQTVIVAKRKLRGKRCDPTLFVFPPWSLQTLQPGKQSLREYSSKPSSSTNHDDLPSFLEHAARIGLNPRSKVYVGTHYEYTVQSSFEGLGMSLKRIGGRSDHGIDLLGTWTLPSHSQSLKVLIQCKVLDRKITPDRARELEGAFVGAPTGWRGSGVLAFLVSQTPASKGVREAIGRSRYPMGYALCSANGKILQMFWNRRAEQGGLEGIGTVLKYAGEGPNEKEVVLTWKGDIIK